MTPELQSILALLVVLLAVGWLARRAIVKRKNPGCGTDCGAVSPELKRLQSHLAKHRR